MFIKNNTNIYIGISFISCQVLHPPNTFLKFYHKIVSNIDGNILCGKEGNDFNVLNGIIFIGIFISLHSYIHIQLIESQSQFIILIAMALFNIMLIFCSLKNMSYYI